MSLWSTTQIKNVKPADAPTPEVKERIIETRKLCSQITVQIPHRPHDGLNAKMLEYAVPWVSSGIELMPVRDDFGGFIDVFRAYLCHEFLRQSNRKYLVMLDSDVIPGDQESPLRLCGHGEPVVSGVACAFNPGVGTFACVAVKDQTGVARFPTTLDTKTMPASGIREIESCGAGYMAIRRDVIETISMSEPPFLLPQDIRIEATKTGSLRKTEDIYFGEQVRRAGYKLYVDFSVQTFHEKRIPLHWPQESLDADLDPADWNVTQSAMAVERR